MSTTTDGIFGFYKGEKKVADIKLERGMFAGIQELYDRKLLPPWYGKEEKIITQATREMHLRQWFSRRLLAPDNPYYNLAKSMEFSVYQSLFDDYYVKLKDDTKAPDTYAIEDDVFAARVLRQADITGISPNLSIYSKTLTLFHRLGDTTYLLQEYSKDLADQKRARKIPYTITIIRDIPFLQVALQPGEYFPIDAVVQKSLSHEELTDLLKTIDPAYTYPLQDNPRNGGYIYRSEEETKITFL